MRFVDEMASVLLPIVSYGAASNLDDLLYLRGVDAAVTQFDVTRLQLLQRGRLIDKHPASSDLHLVSIPINEQFEGLYTPGEFKKQDHPNLLQGQDRIDTIAVSAVVAVFRRSRKG